MPDEITEVTIKEESDSELDRIKEALKKERASRSQFEKSFKEMQTRYQDIDPDEYRSLKEGSKQKEETVKSDFEKKLSATLKQLENERNRRKEVVKRDAIREAFTKAGGKDDAGDGVGHVDLLSAYLGNRISVNDDDVVVILAADGTQDTDDKGEPLSLAKLMLRLKASGATSNLFKPDNTNSGAGIPANMRQRYGGKSVAEIRREIISDMTLTPADKLARARQLGIE